MKSIEAGVATERANLEVKKLQEGDKKFKDAKDANAVSADKLGDSKNRGKEKENKIKEGEKEEKKALSNTLPEVLQAMGNDEELLSLMNLRPGVSPEQFIDELQKIAEKSDQEPSSKDEGDSAGGFTQRIMPKISEMYASFMVAQNRLAEDLRLHKISAEMGQDLDGRINLARTSLEELKLKLLEAERKKYA